MGIRQNKCEVREHNFEISFSQTNATPNSPDPVTYFEDHTLNHYKALINVRLQSVTPVFAPVGTESFLQVVIQPRNNLQEIAVDIPTFFVGENLEGQVVVQTEDAERVSIRHEYRINGEIMSLSSTITGTISIQKDFCICCP